MPAPFYTPDQALQALIDGNRRFYQGEPEHPRQAEARRVEVLPDQRPFAAVLSCSDSRVPAELIFDQGIGDLFIVRTAAAVADEVALGSLEFAVEVLKTPLVIVVGHTLCGAVTAAVKGSSAPGRIPVILDAIAPAVAAVKGLPGDPVANANREHIRRAAGRLAESEPVLAPAVRRGVLKIAAAVYSLETGKVEIL